MLHYWQGKHKRLNRGEGRGCGDNLFGVLSEGVSSLCPKFSIAFD